jgi:hypothetical protein
MGFAANQAVLYGIISRQSDLQLEAIMIDQQKLQLANMTTGLLNMQAKLEPGSQASKILDARIQQLAQADKMLDIQLKRINGQMEALKNERQTVEKWQDENVKSFSMK